MNLKLSRKLWLALVLAAGLVLPPEAFSASKLLFGAGGQPPAYSNTSSVTIDGANERFLAASSSVMSVERTDAWTLSVIFKPTSIATGGVLVSKTKGSSPWSGPVLYFDSSGRIDFQLSSSQGSNWLRLRSSATPISAGTWYRLTIVCNGGTAAGSKMWLNEVEQAVLVSADSLTSTTVNSELLKIGSDWNGTYFPGKIDEVAYWNAAFSDAEVIALHSYSVNLNAHSKAANLVNWWKFDNTISPADSTSVLYDRKGSDNLTPQNLESGDYTSDVAS